MTPEAKAVGAVAFRKRTARLVGAGNDTVNGDDEVSDREDAKDEFLTDLTSGVPAKIRPRWLSWL
jgi:hypothetical protein